MMQQRGLSASDRPAVAALLEALPAFTSEEREVALELVDNSIERKEADEFDYRFILSFAPPEAGANGGVTNGSNGVAPAKATNGKTDGRPELRSGPRARTRKGRASGKAIPGERLAGYLCYGRTPMTKATYDLYWIATSPDFARNGVARDLVASMEAEITREGGGIIRVETGSREGHGAAIHFYDALGFARAAVIADFYAPGDDLLIFTKRVSVARAASFDEMDDPALYDAAFGYRDYPLERDFLLSCAKRFGDREIRRVLSWACGPARHLMAFGDAGIAGVGAEGSETMLAYARKIAGPRAEPLATSFVRADLTEKASVTCGPPVDLSFTMLSAIHTLSSPEAIEQHLRAAAASVAPGGLHVIEATHPTDLTPNGVNHTEWTEVRGDQIVDARFRMQLEKLAPAVPGEIGRTVPFSLEVICTMKSSTPGNANGATGNGSSSYANGSHDRSNSAQIPLPHVAQVNGNGHTTTSTPRVKSLRQDGEWFIPDYEGWQKIIARVPEFQLVATLGDFNADVSFEHNAAWRLILVLKRA